VGVVEDSMTPVTDALVGHYEQSDFDNMTDVDI
jgi:hypothetical protein